MDFKKKILVYEVIPPKGVNLEKCLDLCKRMVDAGADVVAITDMPVGSARMAPWAVAKFLIDEGVEPLVHFTRTSRNILRIESDLLGMSALGVRNLLLLSGDDPKVGDYPSATRVEDISINDLIRLVKLMNEGKDLAGNELKGKTEFSAGAVFNPLLDWDIKRARGKVESGVDFLVSQPIFKKVEFPKLGVPVIMSVAFFKSEKQLRRFGSVPGIEIPKEFFRDLEGRDKDYVADYTFERVLEVVEAMFDEVSGFYVPGIVRDVERVGKLANFIEDLSKKSI